MYKLRKADDLLQAVQRSISLAYYLFDALSLGISVEATLDAVTVGG